MNGFFSRNHILVHYAERIPIPCKGKKILLLLIVMIKSIIELTDLIQKYKQEIFWESEKLKKKFNAFYKNQSIESLEKLKDYKIFGHIDLNVFLYNRKILFSDNPRSLDDVLSFIFSTHKKMDREQIRKAILNHIFMVIYNIVESITQIDQLFKIAYRLHFKKKQLFISSTILRIWNKIYF